MIVISLLNKRLFFRQYLGKFTRSFLFFIVLLIAYTEKGWGFEVIEKQVNESCSLVYCRLNLTEIIIPLSQDNDDRQQINSKSWESLIPILEQMRQAEEKFDIFNYQLITELNLDQEINKQLYKEHFEKAYSRIIEEARSYVFIEENFNVRNLMLYYLAAYFGNADAIFALGYYFELLANDTEILTEDEEKSLRFYCWAAYKNSVQARNRLANAYFNGELGLSKNEILGRMYRGSISISPYNSPRSVSLTSSSSSSRSLPCVFL